MFNKARKVFYMIRGSYYDKHHNNQEAQVPSKILNYKCETNALGAWTWRYVTVIRARPLSILRDQRWVSVHSTSPEPSLRPPARPEPSLHASAYATRTSASSARPEQGLCLLYMTDKWRSHSLKYFWSVGQIHFSSCLLFELAHVSL